MGYDQDLAVIELNGLKIAEARDFADNASYIVTTILSLCLPAAPRVREEYRKLFPATAPDSRSPVSFLACSSFPHADSSMPGAQTDGDVPHLSPSVEQQACHGC